jgi:hypothetical protein
VVVVVVVTAILTFVAKAEEKIRNLSFLKTDSFLTR